ncbi:MAG: 50S ribosomal protein L18 [Candidatus Bathyarchaeota archaeon]|nr:MAG: 50S ribosomal protein L18 [Candidatus Bathyarchaeota archaeon]
MARGPSYRVPFRRRREGKTDYKARRALLISRQPRAVIRASLKHTTVQIIQATLAGDMIIASGNSRQLKAYGWKGACGNLSAAYLTGLLCGSKATEKKVTRAIPDIGMHQPTKGARVFASLKGLMDAGVNLPVDQKKFPDEARLKGNHISNYAKTLASSNMELYEQTFSGYLKRSLKPENLEEHFETVKKAMSLKPRKVTPPRKKTSRKTRRAKEK